MEKNDKMRTRKFGAYIAEVPPHLDGREVITQIRHASDEEPIAHYYEPKTKKLIGKGRVKTTNERKILNKHSGIVHNATQIHHSIIGSRYKLSCGAKVWKCEFGMYKRPTRYTTTDRTVTCKKCLQKGG